MPLHSTESGWLANYEGNLMYETSEQDRRNAMREAYWDRQPWQNRRGILRLAGLLIVSTFASQRAEGTEKSEAGFTGLRENDRVDVGTRCADIIEKAYKLGYDYEKGHGGCCRCTVAALQNAMDFVPSSKGLFRAASCLDGGATPTAAQNCGSFTGAGMFIGWMCGREDFGNTTLSHKLIREVFQYFEKEYGSVLCKDVRKKVDGNCPEVVGRACKWTAEVLLRRFAHYGRK